MKELVILDLDGVIINGQSQKIFLDYLFEQKIIGSFFYLKICSWFLLYRLGLVENPEKIMNYAFSFLKNKKIDEVSKIIDEFFRNELRKFIFPEIIDIIKEHKKNNREIIIVSTSVDIIVKKMADFLGIPNYICTSLGLLKSVFSGKIVGGIVYGEKKAFFVKKFIKEKNDLIKTWAYVDHFSDIELLKMVDYPFVVNPDKKMKKEAKLRNWPILIFKNI